MHSGASLNRCLVFPATVSHNDIAACPDLLNGTRKLCFFKKAHEMIKLYANSGVITHEKSIAHSASMSWASVLSTLQGTGDTKTNISAPVLRVMLGKEADE